MTDDIEVKNASIKIAGGKVKVNGQFAGLATIERAQRPLKRLEDPVDEFSGQAHLA